MRLNDFLLLALLLPCAGAQTSITTPALGYVFDTGLRAIRPVRGIPGAATLGEPLRIGFAPAPAVIAPSQTYALAVSVQAGLCLIRWNATRPSVFVLDSAMASPDKIAFSPSGSAALLYDSSSAHMQILTGLPDSPAVQELQPLGSPASSAFAIADDATVALVSGGFVRTIGPDLNSIPLPLPGTTAALAFNRATDDLLAVTQSGDLYLAQNVNASLNVREVYSGDSQASSPLAVQFSPDGSSAILANSTGVLASIDLNAGSTTALSCQCTPTALQPFGPTGLFRITDVSAGPLFLFDATPFHNRIWFVPAEPQRPAQAQRPAEARRNLQ